jgi:hypothetical protein
VIGDYYSMDGIFSLWQLVVTLYDTFLVQIVFNYNIYVCMQYIPKGDTDI